MCVHDDVYYFSGIYVLDMSLHVSFSHLNAFGA